MIQKGSYGYLAAYKKNKLLWTLAFAFMISAVVIGTLIMFGDTSRVMIIIAILLSLPFAKFLIAYIMVAKFNSMSEEEHKELIDFVEDQSGLYYDLALAQYDGIRFYKSMCIKNGKIIAYVAKPKNVSNDAWNLQKKDYEKWIQNSLNTSKYSYSLNIMNDLESYKKKVNATSEPGDNQRIIDKHLRELIFSNCV